MKTFELNEQHGRTFYIYLINLSANPRNDLRSANSQVTVFACLPTSPSTALSYTNLKLDHLIDEKRQKGHIDNTFRLTFYPAKKLSKQQKYER